MAVPEEYKHVALFWGSTFLAVLLAAVLRAWHVHRALRPQSLSVKRRSLIRRLFSCPIPPRDVFEDRAGGLCLGELLLACSWLVLVAWFLWGTLGPKLASFAEKEGTHFDFNALIVGRQKAVAKSLGTSMRAQLLLLLYPVQRSSLLAWLFGTYHASIVKYHRWMGWALMTTITAHGLLYGIVWMSLGQVISKGLLDVKNFAGVVAALIALCIASTSNQWFRRRYYQAFWLVHVITAPLFFTAVIIHDHAFVYHALPGALLYVLDRAFRNWQHCTNSTHVCVANGGVSVRGSIVTLRTLWSEEGPHGVRAGQTVYVSCPTLSLFQSHPFSIADVQNAAPTAPGEYTSSKSSAQLPVSSGVGASRQQLGLGASLGNTVDEEGDLEDVFDSSMLAAQEGAGGAANRVVVVTLHIRATGEWTRRLKNHALEYPHKPLQIQVEGPYDTEVSDDLMRLMPALKAAAPVPLSSTAVGHCAKDRQKGDQGPGPLVMLAGGIGITPLLGMLRALARSAAPTPSQPSHPHSHLAHDLDHHQHHQQQWKEIELGPPPTHSPQNLRDDCLSCEPGSAQGQGEIEQEPWGVSAEGARAPPPVYLVYSCRRLEELQLLDTQLLDAAVSPHSWLHLHICYTGYELEQHASLQDSPNAGILVASPTQLPSFPQGGAPPRLLYPSLGGRPFLNAAHTALMYVGAALGGFVLPGAVNKLLYRAHMQQPGNLGGGLLRALPLGLGAFLFPLMLLSLLDASRRAKQRTSFGRGSTCSPRCLQWLLTWLVRRGSTHAYAYTSASSDAVDMHGHEETGLLHAAGPRAASLQHSESREQQGSQLNQVQVLPGYILAWGAHLQHRIPLHRGRPELPDLLGCVRGSQHCAAAPHTGKQQHLADKSSPSVPGSSTMHSTPGSSQPHDHVHVGGSSIVSNGVLEGEIRSCADVEAGGTVGTENMHVDSLDGLPLFTGLGGSTQEAEGSPRLQPQQLVRVYVGGPEPLWKSAQRVCERLNREGDPEAAGFEAVRVAHVY